MRCRSVSLSCKGKINHLIRLPLFSYEKLLGVKPLSDTDTRNQRAGKDDAMSRTRRLLYVTCSRAQESLAIVVYTAQPEIAKQQVIEAGWLKPEEIEII